MIASFLFHRLAGPIATGASVLFLAFGMSQCSGRVKAERAQSKAEEALGVAQADLKTCRGNVATLNRTLASQNEAVMALKRDSEARVAESQKAAQQAKTVADHYRKEAAAILAAKPKTADLCAEADALILGSAK